MPCPARGAALGLLGALIREANEWAGDADGDSLLGRLDEAGPDEALEILSSSPLVPGHLVEAVVSAVAALDRHLCSCRPDGPGANTGDGPHSPIDALFVVVFLLSARVALGDIGPPRQRRTTHA
ncbi:hypothetical protein [Kitasatospora griseola]|uniref:hypothetical protein n=1 Tax=Kitasatospora griseola TaxID=2064 RepID=UPI003412C2E0